MITPGTHTYSKYIRPEELVAFFHQYRSPSQPLDASGGTGQTWISRLYNGNPPRTEAETRGMVYLPWKGEWMLVPRGAVGAKLGEGCNYLFWARRPLE